MASKYLALVDNLPKMSPLTLRMLKALSKTNCSVGELADLAERDAALSAKILRTANSLAYGRLQTVTSLRHAISVLGVGVLRKFVLGASVSSLFSRTKNSQFFSMDRFNRHSVATGTMLEVLAEEIPIEHAEQVFVAGLIHDVGELLIAVNSPKEHEQILGLSAMLGESQIACEQQILGVDHAQLSAMAVRKWQMDEALGHALAKHHEGEPQEESKPLKLSNAIRYADEFVNTMGISLLPPGNEVVTLPELEFPGPTFSRERLIGRFEAEWSKLEGMLE